MTQQLLIILLLVFAAILFICYCSKSTDGYMRSDLGEPNMSFRVPPTDYVFKYPGVPSKPEGQPSWYYGNPHLITSPKNKYKPLEFGGVDLWADERKLDASPDDPHALWKQYENNYGGAGLQRVFVPNDQHSRSLLKEVGDVQLANKLGNMWRPAFGPQNPVKEAVREQIMSVVRDPYPQFGNIYTNQPSIIGS